MPEPNGRVRSMRCPCGNSQRPDGHFLGICEECSRVLKEMGRVRNIFFDKPQRRADSEVIVCGVFVWYWRGRWRVDWSRSEVPSVPQAPV